ncbi:PREDICTED: pentatricopeptide repeat-containing protein At4g22760 isoform X1 [Tarenaya hassleriana]|uniref:pentatricopeptide repeat-containing protein At4g22760 isoform X1 n=1 Tax=Tarenaya hassleriana TaxID=28532 RepID=UPI00053CA2E7|nr:PREDICTED: pentatricopeptide repeat-containing protein At4g22760 isoform X1 [Tarenaya hassleriana]XP_010540052.1 PREDICTED: pentatricopeptide repeat-containing protein At4g22760 isoform X1 [Tarenaya hassleriana]
MIFNVYGVFSGKKLTNEMSGSRLKFFLDNCVVLEQAQQVHSRLVVTGYNHLEPVLIHRTLHSTHDYSRKISNYVKRILYGLRNPDSFSWGCVIRFLSRHEQFKEAFHLYIEMLQFGISPSSHAITSTLRACARMESKIAGTLVHAQVLKLGFCGCVYAQTGLVDLYSKLGDMEMAEKAFVDVAEKNVVSWNSILSGYLKSGDLEEARRVFDKIPQKDVVSWNSILSSYTQAGDMDSACSLFQLIPEKSPASWNIMISGYVECKETEAARTFFDAMPEKNGISWTTMISGYAKSGDVQSAKELFSQIRKKDKGMYNSIIACYAQNGQPEEALKLFSEMLKTRSQIQPDEITLSSVISACSQLGDTRFGLWVEKYMLEHEIQMDGLTRTALIDLYMKGGNFAKAFDLFNGLNRKDTVSYSTMIMGCGINGKTKEAIGFFQEMIEKKIRPNSVTFTGLLSAYSHSGLVEDGHKCFISMKDYDLEPSVDHYGIMVDTLGRSGKLEEAYELITSMPMQPNAGVWGALLLASALHNSVEFGEIACGRCLKLENDPSGYLSLLANIYTSVGRWDDAQKLRKAMEEKKLCKTLACSWVESV